MLRRGLQGKEEEEREEENWLCVCAAFNRTLKQKVEIERAEAVEGK